MQNENVVNPNATAQHRSDPADGLSIRLLAPQRGRPLTARVLRPGDSPEAYAMVSRFMATGEVAAESPAEASLMSELGILIPAREISRRPKFVAPAAGAAPDQLGGGGKPALSAQDWDRFSRRARAAKNLVWTQETPWSVINPWRPGGVTLSKRANHDACLTQPEFDAARHAFQTEGFATFRSGVPTAQLSSLRRYFRAVVNEGLVPLGDGQSLRHHAHNEPVARNFQARFLPLAQGVVGHPIKPSYCYFINYLNGAELPRHLDRVQCQYTATILLDCKPLSDRRSTWPICFHTGETEIAVLQNLGDVAMYRGPERPHSRPVFEGVSSTSLILHYVDIDFDGALD